MIKKEKVLRYVLTAIALGIGIVFVAKFGGPNILKLYIVSGMGDCRANPIFCKYPDAVINLTTGDQQYKEELQTYEFSQMSIAVPRGFNLIQETIKKIYYKRHRKPGPNPVIYVMYKGPDFFLNLYPQFKKRGITDNYEFIKRVMSADLNTVSDIPSAFFLIMKGIFLPNLGDQDYVRMAAFSVGSKRGFINYNIVGPRHYFDCNVIDADGDFFKVYINDYKGSLDLPQVMTIISTLRKNK